MSLGESASLKIAHRKPDFGTYHHATPRNSEETRNQLRVIFARTFKTLPFLRDQKIKILDMGCGLGFLSCLCAEFYPKAVIIGFDTFENSSLKGSSIGMAE